MTAGSRTPSPGRILPAPLRLVSLRSKSNSAVNRSSICVNLLLVALLASRSGAQTAADVHSVAHAVDEHYNQLRTLEAEFSEIYRGAGMDRSESGTLWLKKPGKMRWEYRSPKDKLFLSDGRDAWFYLPGDKQARRTPMRKLEDLRSPLGFLLGKTRLEKELQSLGFAPDVAPLGPGDVVLRGVPKAMADRVSEVLIEITPSRQINRIQIEEVDGSTTEYRFSKQRENVRIGDEPFQFTPPPGVETIDGEAGQ
jgi:outer membrane lipoprotein carrier protein